MATNTNATGERFAGPERVPAELLDVRAVASMLQCSCRHVRRLADGGRMPTPTRLGSLVRWRRRELQNWLEAGCPSVRASKGGAR
ncbi:MAG: helix-turn-helix domain-containing protein [Planctomycetes bacterium]|nr:helix-turn-helix domain-containing protein [Planctomycetota bacterium]